MPTDRPAHAGRAGATSALLSRAIRPATVLLTVLPLLASALLAQGVEEIELDQNVPFQVVVGVDAHSDTMLVASVLAGTTIELAAFVGPGHGRGPWQKEILTSQGGIFYQGLSSHLVWRDGAAYLTVVRNRSPADQLNFDVFLYERSPGGTWSAQRITDEGDYIDTDLGRNRRSDGTDLLTITGSRIGVPELRILRGELGAATATTSRAASASFPEVGLDGILEGISVETTITQDFNVNSSHALETDPDNRDFWLSFDGDEVWQQIFSKAGVEERVALPGESMRRSGVHRVKSFRHKNEKGVAVVWTIYEDHATGNIVLTASDGQDRDQMVLGPARSDTGSNEPVDFALFGANDVVASTAPTATEEHAIIAQWGNRSVVVEFVDRRSGSGGPGFITNAIHARAPFFSSSEPRDGARTTSGGAALLGEGSLALVLFDPVVLFDLPGNGACVSGSESLCLSDRRFEVGVTWTDTRGKSGQGQVVPGGSNDSGLFYFFAPGNWEMLVKIVDGRALNDHFWVLAASTTNLGLELRITDTETGRVVEHRTEAGSPAPPILDTTAFSDSGSMARAAREVTGLERHARPGWELAGPLRSLLGSGPTGKGLASVGGAGCTPGDEVMCLKGRRFRVEVAWADFRGNPGRGQVVSFGSDDSGLFWFLSPDNWEMLVKVLDGCGINDRYWVFSAATTNVEYTLRVTDSETGEVREYRNPPRQASEAITDTDAFAGCP